MRIFINPDPAYLTFAYVLDIPWEDKVLADGDTSPIFSSPDFQMFYRYNLEIFIRLQYATYYAANFATLNRHQQIKFLTRLTRLDDLPNKLAAQLEDHLWDHNELRINLGRAQQKAIHGAIQGIIAKERAATKNKMAPADFIAYEYHFWKAQFYCPSCLTFAKRLHDDVLDYRDLGLVGVMEDMSQRHFFPNALAFAAYARTMYDCDMDLDAFIDDYFAHAYGEAGGIVKTFFTELEKAFPQKFVDTPFSLPMDMKKYHDKKMIPRLKKAVKLCDKLDKDLAPYRDMPFRVQTVAVRLLGHYTQFLRGLAGAFLIKLTGDDTLARERYLAFMDEFSAHEQAIEPYYDHYLAGLSLLPIFNSAAKLPEM